MKPNEHLAVGSGELSRRSENREGRTGTGLVAAYLILALVVASFIYRGPYRAVTSPVAGDFAMIYAATRCWIHGANPYDHSAMANEFVAAVGPVELVPKRQYRTSVYFITAMPLVAAVSWLRWNEANLIWALLSAASFVVFLPLVYSAAQFSRLEKVLLAIVVFAFWPTTSGLVMGNPSVLTINLIALGIYGCLRDRPVMAGLCAGVALCIKPQLAICAIGAFAIWRHFLPLVVSGAVLAVLTAIGSVRARSVDVLTGWWHTLQENIQITLSTGGINDSGPGNPYAFHLLNAQAVMEVIVPGWRWNSILLYALTGLLLCIYMWRRRAAARSTHWHDVAFLSAWTIAVTYHRYYDGQILLLVLPLLCVCWKARMLKGPALLILACMAVLAFPLQFWAAAYVGSGAVKETWLTLILFRHAPLAVLIVLLVLTFVEQCRTVQSPGERSGTPA